MSHDRTSLQHLQHQLQQSHPQQQPQQQQYKVKIPRPAANYTAATMDLDIRSRLNVQLVAGGHDKKIQEHVLYALNAHPNNWPTQVQARALALLRSGEATTFPQLLKQVLEEVRRETALEPSAPQTSQQGSSSTPAGDTTAPASNGGAGGSNGDAATVAVVNGGGGGSKKANGASANPGPGEAGNLHTNTSTSLAVPRAVVDDALKVTKEALLSVAEFSSDEENGAT